MELKEFRPSRQGLHAQMPHLEEIFHGTRNYFFKDYETGEFYREARYGEMDVFYRYTLVEENGAWLLAIASEDTISSVHLEYSVHMAGVSRQEARRFFIERLCQEYENEQRKFKVKIDSEELKEILSAMKIL